MQSVAFLLNPGALHNPVVSVDSESSSQVPLIGIVELTCVEELGVGVNFVVVSTVIWEEIVAV